MEKKSSLHFAGRRHSKKGIIATVMAGVAWCVLIVLCVRAALMEEGVEPVAGMIGILDAFLALAGMFLGWKGLQEREVYYVLPILGLVLNGVLFVVYFSMYFMGIVVLFVIKGLKEPEGTRNLLKYQRASVMGACGRK